MQIIFLKTNKDQCAFVYLGQFLTLRVYSFMFHLSTLSGITFSAISVLLVWEKKMFKDACRIRSMSDCLSMSD